MSYAAKIGGIAGLVLGCAVGCARQNDYVRPTSAQVVTAENAVNGARAAGAEKDRTAALFLAAADRELAQGKHGIERGDDRTAVWMLARAAADADLGHALADRIREEREAKKSEDQLAETRQQLARPEAPAEPGAPNE